MVERSIAWLTRNNRKVRYRGVNKNNHWLHHRAAALNLRRMITMGLTHTGYRLGNRLTPARSRPCPSRQPVPPSIRRGDLFCRPQGLTSQRRKTARDAPPQTPLSQQAPSHQRLGDSASAEGGFLNSYIDSPSTSSEPVKCWALTYARRSLPHAGLFAVRRWLGELRQWRQRSRYVLRPPRVPWLDIARNRVCGAPITDGMTEYVTIQDSMVNSLEALWTQLQIADSVLF